MRTLAISGIAHAAVVAAWWSHTPEPPPPPAPAPSVALVEVELATPPPPPTPTPAPAPTPTPAPAPGSAAAQPRVALATVPRASTGSAPAAAEPPRDADPSAPPSSRLAMRRPGESDRGRVELPTKIEWDPDMAPEAPPVVEEPSGKLRPDGGGTYRSNQGPFTAKVGKDGSVSLKDGANLRVRFALPSPRQLGKMIGDWYQDPNKPVGFLPPPDPEKFERDHLTGGGYGGDKSDEGGGGAGLPIVAGGFDITDAFMRSKGNDPYASKKLAFLDATRAERVQIGMRHKSEQLAQVTELMQRNLQRLWATVADPAERRAALFDLWDEVEETGSDELVAAGLRARALLIGWIRAKLPAGSPAAYSDTELSALNARRTSKTAFAPYGSN